MSVIHISGAEAGDLASLMAQVHAGRAQIVIEDGLVPPVMLRVVAEPDASQLESRTLTKSLKLVEAHAKKRGYDVVMDADFAADVEGRIRARKPRDTSAWD